ncbi:MAG TPA: TIGR02588 family protein [Crinalium sp.]|jgi:uncharacterized protein (TIGR02588 family)
MSQIEQTNSSESDLEQDQEQGQARSHRTPAEWVTLGISSFILAGLIGLVVYVWLDQERQRPPAISVTEPQSIRETDGQFYIPFEVTNTGGGTAESVQIMAELTVNGEVVESGEQQIDFLSGGETAEGAFVFSQDPRSGEVTIRVASYKLP